jgi:restriction endonuclease S subunit
MVQSVWVEPGYVTTGRFAAEFYAFEYLSLERQLAEAGRRFDLKPLGDLGKLFTGPFGSKLPTSTFVEQGVPLLRVQNVGELEVLLGNLANIGWDTHREIIRSKLQSGDLAIAKAGRIGTTAIIPAWMPECNITQHIVGMRVNRSKVDNHYLAAFLASKYSGFQFERQGVGTLLKYLGVEDTRQATVVLPPRPVQEYIGAKVRLAERCRAQARELWKESGQLFAEALGISLEAKYFERIDRTELQSASYQLVSVSPVATWVQPDIVERELGAHYFHPRRANVILKLRSSGVELGRLADLAERRGERVRADEVSQVPYYVGLADIDGAMGHFEPVFTREAGISGTSALFRSGDILFSKLRPYLNKVSICPDHIERACGSTELLVYRAYSSVLPYYVFFAIKSNLGLYQIIDVTTGSTLPRVDPEIVDDILVPIIPVEQQQTIDATVRRVLAISHRATQLIREAKADVEALIEGRLDVVGIVAGQVHPPTWEEIRE